MIGHFEGTIKGVYQPKARGEYRSVPGKIPTVPDLEKIILRALCLFLFTLLLYLNVGPIILDYSSSIL